MASPGGFLRPASFRGVPFEVRRDGRMAPRALQIDEFPMSNRWRVVDLGRKAVSYREDAYVADEDKVELRMMALEAALEADGPGLLILPQRKPVMAWARAPESTWESKELGYFTFRIEFVEDGQEAAAAPTLGLAESLVGEALGSVAALAGSFGAALSGFAGALGAAVFEASAFISEGLAMFDMVASIATGIGDLADTVAGVGTIASWTGLGEIFDGLSLAGDVGLAALEAIALGEEWIAA